MRNFFNKKIKQDKKKKKQGDYQMKNVNTLKEILPLWQSLETNMGEEFRA